MLLFFSFFGKKITEGVSKVLKTFRIRKKCAVENTAFSSLHREFSRKTEEKINEIEQEMATAHVIRSNTLFKKDTLLGQSDLPKETASISVPLSNSLTVKPINSVAKTTSSLGLTPTDASSSTSTSKKVLPGNFYPQVTKSKSRSEFGSIGPNTVVLPSPLQEAAILYSNGQLSDALWALHDAINQANTLGSYQALGWLMLLDLYRVLNDTKGFNDLAAKYAIRFKTDPPKLIENLTPPLKDDLTALRDKHNLKRLVPKTKKDSLLNPVLFALPTVLDYRFAKKMHHLLRLNQSSTETGMRNTKTVLDASLVEAVDRAAASALLRVIYSFESTKTSLTITGTESIIRAAYQAVSMGQQTDNEPIWMLILQILRLLGWQDDFDDFSIDYCSQFEVPPPPWTSTTSVKATISEAETSSEKLSSDDGDELSFFTNKPVDQINQKPQLYQQKNYFLPEQFEDGCINLDLRALKEFAKTHTTIFIDCRYFRRIKFLEVSDLLHIVSLLSSTKRIVFVEPNYLVYALFQLIGLGALAEIRMRKC